MTKARDRAVQGRQSCPGRRTAALVALAIASLPAVAGGAAGQSAGDSWEGRALAERSCAACHAIAPERPGAPSFFEIANRPETTIPRLRVFLRTPHDRMPAIVLSADEIEDVIAFILILRRR